MSHAWKRALIGRLPHLRQVNVSGRKQDMGLFFHWKLKWNMELFSTATIIPPSSISLSRQLEFKIFMVFMTEDGNSQTGLELQLASIFLRPAALFPRMFGPDKAPFSKCHLFRASGIDEKIVLFFFEKIADLSIFQALNPSKQEVKSFIDLPLIALMSMKTWANQVEKSSLDFKLS